MSILSNQITEEIKKVIHGKDDIIQLTLAAILAGGHVLLEDIPGVGKTTLAMAFAKALSMDYKRVQFTPDVLPSDLVGFNLYDKNLGEFRFQEGSIYTNLFLADEINRTSPKTQSALLEVMEEGRATVEGVTRPMPKPFFVIATQNPIGSSGTQKLPESQLDRFMVCLSMGYPDFESALDILKGNSHQAIEALNKPVSKENLLAMQEEVAGLFIDDSIYEYIIRITEATRNPDFFSLGLSPRGSIALLKMAKAYAYIKGRSFVSPEEVQDVFYAVANHRVIISPKAKAAGQTTSQLLTTLLTKVSLPKVSIHNGAHC